MEECLTYTISELVPLLRARKISPVEVTQACLSRIEAVNPTLNAYVTVLADQALSQAQEAEKALARGDAQKPLLGVPLSLKDVYETAGVRTTWGARNLEHHVPSEDATVVARLRRAGATLLGKVNADMYPYDGTPTSPRLIGPTRNPWNPQRIAGRSSGGSGAAVAARLDYGSLGSDTGGSIRLPAALCGVYGLKPSFGLVSNHRVFPYSRSFDCCGPLTRSARDCALLLEAIAGHDPNDPTTVDRPAVAYMHELDQPVRGLRIGLPRTVAWEDNDPAVTRLVDEAVAVLVGLGMSVREVDLPDLQQGQWGRVVSVLETLEMAGMLAPGKPADAYAAYMWERGMESWQELLGLATRHVQALRGKYAEVFQTVDLLALPAIPITAPRFTDDGSPWQRLGETFPEIVPRYLRIFNVVNCPAISVPCGFADDGMPVGFQIAGRPFEEGTVLRAAHAYQRETGWHLRHPG